MSLAYQVVGEGPIDLVFEPAFVNNIEIAWESPHYARFLRRLAPFSRLTSWTGAAPACRTDPWAAGTGMGSSGKEG